MTEIEKIIIKNIESNGSLSLEEYMTITLYHPQFGYYSKKNIIGKSGDFITSPEVSQVFGELIASCEVNLFREEAATIFPEVDLADDGKVFIFE